MEWYNCRATGVRVFMDGNKDFVSHDDFMKLHGKVERLRGIVTDLAKIPLPDQAFQLPGSKVIPLIERARALTPKPDTEERCPLCGGELPCDPSGCVNPPRGGVV